MLIDHIILAAAWIIYCILHSVFASLSVKNKMRNAMGGHFKFYRFYYTLFAFFGFAALIYYLITLPSLRLFQINKLTNTIGWCITIAGGIIVGWCILKYFFQLSGLRSLVTETKSNELMITGIHKYVRHPLYSGTFIFIWGLWVLMPSAALMISDFIITVYTLIGIGFEEKKLENEFGEQYKKYRRTVPMLVPRLRF